MTTRHTPTAPHKLRASAHIRRLAQDVKRTFPDMDVHEHLHDAAREIDAGRHENAKRHLDAAINSFAPLQITRHGIHDDTGHMAAKSFMQRAHRGRLLAADVEHISGANQEMFQNRKDAATAAAQDKAERRQAAVVPIQAVKAMSWEDIDVAIELATFAGKPPGSGANFAKLKGSLAKRGAKNPGALAAYIGRKKYGKKGFAALGHATPTAGGIELVGPKGYIHGWIKASASALARSGGGAYLPDHPGFGAMTPKEHRRVAAGHLAMMKKAPAGSQKAGMHHKFAKMHAAASMGRTVQRSGYAIAGSRGSTSAFANLNYGIELVGPKGYSHGWVYHGPGGGKPGRFFMEGKQVSRREYQQRTNASNAVQGLRPAFPHTGQPARPPAGPDLTRARQPGTAQLPIDGGLRTERTAPTVAPRVRGWVTRDRAAQYDGQEGMRGDTGNGVVVGKYNHQQGTVTDRKGVAHQVYAIDPTAHEAGFKGDVATSHLDADTKRRMEVHARAYRTGALYRNIVKSQGGQVIGMTADTGRLASEPHPFGKPSGPGLWGVKGMELPPYIQNIARALLRTGRAKSLSQAIAMAKGATARWAVGKNTSPEVRAASSATNASWAAKQARAHAHANNPAHPIDLTGTAAGAALDARTPTGQFGSGGAAPAGDKARQRQQLMSKIKLEKQRITQLHQLIHALQVSEQASARKRQQATKAGATGKTASSAPAKKQAAQTTSSNAPAGRAGTAPAPAKPGAKRLSRPKQIAAYQQQIVRLAVQIKAQQRQLARL
jgi:hypothetical protein